MMTSHLTNTNNFNELIELKYGPVGQPARDDFENQSQLFIIAELFAGVKRDELPGKNEC